MILVQCPSCKKVHSSPESMLGKKVRCNDCQHVFVVTHDTGLVDVTPTTNLPPHVQQKPVAAHSSRKRIRYRCPRCKSKLESGAHLSGGADVCPVCKFTVAVPLLRKPNWLLRVAMVVGVIAVIGATAFVILSHGWDVLKLPVSASPAVVGDGTGVRSTARPKTEGRRFSDTMAFYEKTMEILELKKDGTFYLDKSLYRAIYKSDARRRGGQLSESDLLEQGRKGETFSSIDSDGVSGQWRKDGDAIMLATSSGMSLRLVKKDDVLFTEGTYRGTYVNAWRPWTNWEEDWKRLQESREQVGILRPEHNTAPLESNLESNIAGPSMPRRRRIETTDPNQIKIRSSPPSISPNEVQQIAGVRTVPRFTEPPLECVCPSWSPDGKYVMFVARPTEQAGGNLSKGPWDSGVLPGNVWVISADGSQKWLVSDFFFGKLRPPDGRRADPLKLDVTALSWSPDGEKIAFSAYEGEDRPQGLQTNLYVMKADATDIFQVAQSKGWGELGNGLQWMPDGKGLLLRGDEVAATIDLEGTKLSPLTAHGAEKLTNACCSPDGAKIAAIVKERAEIGLCVMDRTSGQLKWLTRGQQFGGGGTTYRPRSWSPDGKQIAAGATNDVGLDRHIAIFDVASGKARRLVDGSAPSWSPDAQRIAFVGGLGDQGNIYLIGPDGKNLQRITNPTPSGLQMIWGSHPCWSPDGRQIVFRRGQYIWVANRDGSGQFPVTTSTDHSRVTNAGIRVGPFEWTPRWKPDGGIVFTPYKEATWGAAPEFEVAVANVDGTGVHRLMALKSPADGDEVCWSSDGSWLAFDKNENIWVARGDGTEQRRLTGGRHPRWSPDGQKILYVQGSEDNEVLCIVNADGNNQTQITEPSDGYRAHHSWCPDGKSIAFEGSNGLSVVSVRGGNARQLVWGQQPCWSPDGHKIAFCAMGRFTSDTTTQGPPCVYVMNADGSGMCPVMQVDKTAYGDNLVNNLSWSPDNKHILFEETAKSGYDYENRHHIWIVDVGEPVFYQASYVASELLPWKVPQFESVPRTVSTNPAEGGASSPGADKSPLPEEPRVSSPEPIKPTPPKKDNTATEESAINHDYEPTVFVSSRSGFNFKIIEVKRGYNGSNLKFTMLIRSQNKAQLMKLVEPKETAYIVDPNGNKYLFVSAGGTLWTGSEREENKVIERKPLERPMRRIETDRNRQKRESNPTPSYQKFPADVDIKCYMTFLAPPHTVKKIKLVFTFAYDDGSGWWFSSNRDDALFKDLNLETLILDAPQDANK